MNYRKPDHKLPRDSSFCNPDKRHHVEFDFFILVFKMEWNVSRPHTAALAATVLLVTVLGTYFYQRRKKVPTEWVEVGKVQKIHLYPLKSGRRKSLKKAEVGKDGIKQTEEEERAYQLRDRELIVYNANDFEFRTARTYPKMVLIETNVHDENHFSFDAPGMRTLYVKIPKTDGRTVFVKCWYSEQIKAVDCGDEASVWFSRYILEKDSGLRLGYFQGSFKRDIEKAHGKFRKFYTNLRNEYAGRFSDMGAVHIVNQSSVDDLNARIGSTAVVPENFRANLVIDSDPWAEDSWDYVRVGEVIFRTSKPCTRCVFTTINPETGIRSQVGEPLKTLREYHPIKNEELRKLENNSPVMGLNCGVVKTGFVSVGDVVYVPK